jgi:hypothetical protein
MGKSGARSATSFVFCPRPAKEGRLRRERFFSCRSERGIHQRTQLLRMGGICPVAPGRIAKPRLIRAIREIRGQTEVAAKPPHVICVIRWPIHLIGKSRVIVPNRAQSRPRFRRSFTEVSPPNPRHKQYRPQRQETGSGDFQIAEPIRLREAPFIRGRRRQGGAGQFGNRPSQWSHPTGADLARANSDRDFRLRRALAFQSNSNRFKPIQTFEIPREGGFGDFTGNIRPNPTDEIPL